jgi:hypothetical protein
MFFLLHRRELVLLYIFTAPLGLGRAAKETKKFLYIHTSTVGLDHLMVEIDGNISFAKASHWLLGADRAISLESWITSASCPYSVCWGRV